MPQADLLERDAARSAPETVRRTVHGWGGGEGVPASVISPANVEQLAAAVVGAAPGAIPRGMGRAYGDAAQRRDGLVLDTRGLRAFELDAETGTVTAQAGITLGELLAHCVPAGWMVPVVPGTQHVSVGGAVASDIHGKNHGTASTFGRHVQALGLLTSEGELLEVGPGDPAFEATLGGMGLTGVIVWARIALRPASGALLSVDLDRVVGLDAALAALQAPGGSYRVCWLDLLARRPRGVVTRAEHLDWSGPAGTATVAGRATVPTRWPSGLLRAGTVRAFNELRFRSMPARARGRIESIGAHMFPLDALDAWPRLYGEPGFRQYQIAVPPDRSDVLESVIERLRRAHVPCFLAVLKDFGPANGAPLSFPIAGWTLTLDLPRAAPNLDATLDECDPIVAEAGGRVYFAKDDRARGEVVRAMYPRLAEWQEVRDRLDPKRLWTSDLAVRAGLIA